MSGRSHRTSSPHVAVLVVPWLGDRGPLCADRRQHRAEVRNGRGVRDDDTAMKPCMGLVGRLVMWASRCAGRLAVQEHAGQPGRPTQRFGCPPTCVGRTV